MKGFIITRTMAALSLFACFSAQTSAAPTNETIKNNTATHQVKSKSAGCMACHQNEADSATHETLKKVD